MEVDKSPPSGEVIHGRVRLKTEARSNELVSHIATGKIGLPATTIQVELAVGNHECHYKGLNTRILLVFDNHVCMLVFLGECVCLSD